MKKYTLLVLAVISACSHIPTEEENIRTAVANWAQRNVRDMSSFEFGAIVGGDTVRLDKKLHAAKPEDISRDALREIGLSELVRRDSIRLDSLNHSPDPRGILQVNYYVTFRTKDDFGKTILHQAIVRQNIKPKPLTSVIYTGEINKAL